MRYSSFVCNSTLYNRASPAANATQALLYPRRVTNAIEDSVGDQLNLSHMEAKQGAVVNERMICRRIEGRRHLGCQGKLDFSFLIVGSKQPRCQS